MKGGILPEMCLPSKCNANFVFSRMLFHRRFGNFADDPVDEVERVIFHTKEVINIATHCFGDRRGDGGNGKAAPIKMLLHLEGFADALGEGVGGVAFR